MRRLLGRSLELIDHLAFGQLHATERDGKTKFGHVELDIHFANADFADERMVIAIAALGGIAECQQETFITACQCLKAQIAFHRECPRFASQVARFVTFRQGTIILDHANRTKNIGYTRRLFLHGFPHFGFRNGNITGQIWVEQTVRVIKGRSEQLTARQILVGRRNATFDQHFSGFHRPRIAKTRQGCAVGAHQKDCLDQIAARLTNSKCRQFAIIERTFGHDAINRQRQLFGNLVETQSRNRTIAATTIIEKTVGIMDGRFATLYGNIHFQPSRAETRVVRGSAATAPSLTRTRSTPSGYCAPFSRHCWMKSCGRPST